MIESLTVRLGPTGEMAEDRIHVEKQLAEVALRERPCSQDLHRFRRNEQRCKHDRSHGLDYREYGLIPIHHDAESWLYVSEDPQLAVAIEEIVNTFSPNLSIELLLYNVLGSNSESSTCLV